jgi:hypothetical protein
MDSESRLASKGIADDVQGTPAEIQRLLLDEDDEFLRVLYPNMIEFKVLQKISEDTCINYSRFKGMGPVADRDFVLLGKSILSEDGSLLLDASVSLDYPHPQPKGVVRG